MGFNNRRALIEASLMATIASFFAIGTLYIPILTILIMLLPVPFIILAIRHNIRYTVLSLIITSLLVGVLTGIIYTGFILVIFAPVTLAMGYYIKRQNQPYEVIGIGAAVSALSVFAIIQLISVLGGVDFISEIAQMMNAALDHQMEMIGTMNIEPIHVRQAINYLMMILPALIIVQSMLMAFINYYLVATIVNRFKWREYTLSSFSEFQLPRHIVTGSFIIVVLTVLTNFLEGIDHTSLMANVTIIFVVIFFLQGITFISHLLKKTKVNKYLRIGIIILILSLSPLMTIVALAGLVSTIFHKKEREKE